MEQRVLKGLSNKYQLVIFDNRGNGRSDKPDIEYSIKIMADDTANLMDSLNIPKSHILGISMGSCACSTACVGKETYEEFLGFVTSCAKGMLPKMSSQEMMRCARAQATLNYNSYDRRAPTDHFRFLKIV